MSKLLLRSWTRARFSGY